MSFKKLFVFLALLCIAGTSIAQSSAELKRRKDALTREIAELKRSQSKVTKNKRLSLRQINVLNTQIRLREEKIRTINSEVKLLNNQITESSNTVRSLQAQLDKLKKEYAGMVLFAFRNQSSYGKLMFIFASDNFNQAYKRLKYLQQFGDYRKKQARYIRETQQELGMKITELDRNKKQKSNLLHSQENEKVTLGKEKKNQAVELSKLTKQERQLRQEVSRKQKEVAQLNRSINAAINREIAEARRRAEAEARAEAAKTGTTAKPVASGSKVLATTPEAAKLSADFLSNRGRLPWPVSTGNTVAHFGTNRYGNVTVENNGVDIETPPGSSVRAVFSGEVTKVLNLGGAYVVLIKHGEYFTVYSNLRSASVSQGEKVSVKQTIGTVITDNVDGTTQLHFEIRKGATAMNPESWLAN
nr:peptidoglycan DD-metalloendopeptidase family protein [Pedobacter mongoliensis]